MIWHDLQTIGFCFYNQEIKLSEIFLTGRQIWELSQPFLEIRDWVAL